MTPAAKPQPSTAFNEETPALTTNHSLQHQEQPLTTGVEPQQGIENQELSITI